MLKTLPKLLTSPVIKSRILKLLSMPYAVPALLTLISQRLDTLHQYQLLITADIVHIWKEAGFHHFQVK